MIIRKLILVFLLLPTLALATPSGYGTCTKATTITTASTSVLLSDDVPGGRHYLYLQNIGSVNAFCAIGATATTSNGLLLPATGGSHLFAPFEGPNGVFILAPGDAINCITASSSTTVVSCDY
jgi:hypothetical protein